MRHVGAACLGLLLLTGAAHASGTLRIGLNEDPDALDPARGGSFVGRMVFAAVCDKLVDIDAQNNFVPQLATAWAWSPDNLALTVTLRDGVKFHDGEAMDADAVKANLERYRTAPESLRKGELKPVSSVEVVDPHTVRLHLSQPYAPLVAVLADRAGMMISPKALGARRDARSAVRRPVQADRARRAGSHRGRSLSRLLECRRDQAGSHRVSAAPRYHGAAGQSAGGTARHGGAAGADRCRDGEAEREAAS